MYKCVLTSLLIVGLFPPHIQAATEFLRFKGSIHHYYDDTHRGYDASLGIVQNQSVYFDFQIDTNLDVAGKPDSSYQDIFSVTYLSGAVAGPNVTFGATSDFPEGLTTWLFITNSLRVGTSWNSLGNPSDASINTWSVGDNISLMNNSYFEEYVIGSLVMTHRDSAPPPAIVPIPAALWLFVSGLSIFSCARRKRVQR